MDEQKNPQEVLLRDIAATVKSIRRWVVFFGVVVILALGGSCALITQAYGGTASIVASFKSPCANAWGIDYHNGYIYHADGIEGGYIYQTDTKGFVTGRIPNLTGARGIDRTPSGFWTCNFGGWVNRLSTTGSVLSSFKIGARGSGITTDGGDLWFTERYYVFRMTTNGSIIRSFKPPTTYVAGICWGAPYLWIADNDRYLYLINEIGPKVMDSFRLSARPYGVTREGSYLWYTTPYWVYKIRPIFTAVAPASLGKVKALYR